MNISPELLERVNTLINQARLQNGPHDASNPLSLPGNPSNTLMLQRLTFLKFLSLGLAFFVILLIILAAVMYFRQDSKDSTLSKQEIEDLVRRKVQEKLREEGSLESSNLTVQWTLESSESNGSTNTLRSGELELQALSQTSESFEICENSLSEDHPEELKENPLCSVESYAHEEMKEDEFRFAEVSTHVQTIAPSKDSSVRNFCFMRRRECDLLKKGMPGLQSKLTKSRSEKH